MAPAIQPQEADSAGAPSGGSLAGAAGIGEGVACGSAGSAGAGRGAGACGVDAWGAALLLSGSRAGAAGSAGVGRGAVVAGRCGWAGGACCGWGCATTGGGGVMTGVLAGGVTGAPRNTSSSGPWRLGSAGGGDVRGRLKTGSLPPCSCANEGEASSSGKAVKMAGRIPMASSQGNDDAEREVNGMAVSGCGDIRRAMA